MVPAIVKVDEGEVVVVLAVPIVVVVELAVVVVIEGYLELETDTLTWIGRTICSA